MRDTGGGRPMVLAASIGNRREVAAACPRALRYGVKVGMSLSHARAVLPSDAVIEEHAPATDAATLNHLARWALRFTPIVQPDSPDGLLLEITGCDHLFGGAPAMLRQVTRSIHTLGFQGRAAIAPTVGGAWALARFAKAGTIVESSEALAEAIAPLPVHALRIDTATQQALHAVAIERVGQLQAVSRQSLGERFGDSLLRRLDQASGEAFEGVEPVRPEGPVYVQRTFAGPVKQLEAVLEAGRELVCDLCDVLLHREAGARVVRLHMQRIDASDLDRQVTLSRPSLDVKHLWRLLRPKLEDTNLGFGIERLTLQATAIGRLPHHQPTIGEWAASAQQSGRELEREIGTLIDQYHGRFGALRVSMVEPRDTHVPERRFTHRPIAGHRPEAVATAGRLDADRPTRLWERPEPVKVALLAPGGPLLWMQHRGRSLRIRRSIGPERITPRWWLAPDASRQLPPRDYFKAQDEHGRWWWLYRQTGAAHWYVHGLWC